MGGRERVEGREGGRDGWMDVERNNKKGKGSEAG